MRSRSIIGVAAVASLLSVVSSCSGLKDALTAHVDVVARAGSQELSVNRLGDLLGNAKIQVPVTKENAAIVTDLWTGYEQIAYAAAHGDSQSLAELMVVEQVAHALGDSARARPSRKRGSGAEASEARRDVVLVAALGDAQHRDASSNRTHHAPVTTVGDQQ